MDVFIIQRPFTPEQRGPKRRTPGQKTAPCGREPGKNTVTGD